MDRNGPYLELSRNCWPWWWWWWWWWFLRIFVARTTAVDPFGSRAHARRKSIIYFNPLKPSGHYMYRQFNIQKFHALPTQYMCVFCFAVRANGDFSTIQHWWIGFYNRDGVCLLRGADWVFIYRQFNIQQFYVLPTQCIYVFCVSLGTNSDCFPMQH